MRLLTRYRAKSLQDETRLQYLPVIYVTATNNRFEPAMRLDLASDPDKSMGHEKYHRDAANMLIELLQWVSVKTIARLSAGPTALRN